MLFTKGFPNLVGCLVVFYGISTLVDYLMLNPVYVKYIWFVNELFIGNNFYTSQGSFVCT